MRNRDEQQQDCFIAVHDEELSEAPTPRQEFHFEISQAISRHLPANELRTARRPQHMVPRTFFLQRPLQTLPGELNLPTSSPYSDPLDSAKVKQRIQNIKNLTLEEYFRQKKFTCVYNKLQDYPPGNQSFVGRLKGVDYLVDYNWKCFTELRTYHASRPPPGTTPQLESNFEGGNLCRVYQKKEDEEWFFYCLIQNDVNTHGYNNWFFFRCRNTVRGRGKFKIANMIKRTAFFAQGMQISCFSLRKWQKQGIGWFLGGQCIGFNRINLGRSRHNDQYYSLYFEYQFQHENDEVYFALGQPYTYSRLAAAITSIRTVNSPALVEVKTLTYSICNNIIPLVKFSLPNRTYSQSILILGRQHPCQTVGSFIAEAVMQALTQPNPVMQWLLEEFEIIVIPMVNPDGVIHGMSRTNMAGLDLNRHWGDHIIKQLTPETLKIKSFILNLSKTRKIKYMLDLHGHGKKLSSFFFCCRSGENQHENYRMLVMAMGKFQERFSMQSCTFGIDRDKESTVRSMLHSMGIKHSYTLETSLFGYRNKQGVIVPFGQTDYRSIGENILKSVFLMEAPSSLCEEVLCTTRQAVSAEMTPLFDTIEKDEQLLLENQQNISDSDPEGDRLDVKELLSKCCNKVIRKKIQQSINADRKKKKRFSIVDSKKRLLVSETISSQSQISNKMASTQFSRLLSRHENSRHKKKEKSISINPKATVTGQRWKDRKEKPNLSTGQEKKTQIMESLNLTRPKLRHRIRTQPNSETGDINSRKMGYKRTLKTFAPGRRLVAKAIDVTDFAQIPREVQILEDKVVERDRIVRDVREGNFNHFLTDTMSIIKITPHPKYTPFSKQTSCDPRKERVLIRHSDRTHPQSPTHKDHPKTDLQVKRIHPCNQASRNGLHRSSKSGNSVLYYFPIL